MHRKILDSSNAALVVVDIQEGFRRAINDFPTIAWRASMAVRGFLVLGLPVIITEQYPEGLGRTAEEIILSLPPRFEFVKKTSFSSCGAAGFLEKLEDTGAKQVVLCGLETHVCINQTAHDLLAYGYDVHLLSDCVTSRFEHDKQAGLAKMRENGVVTSSVEMALFELLRGAKHERFKEIQKLIK